MDQLSRPGGALCYVLAGNTTAFAMASDRTRDQEELVRPSYSVAEPRTPPTTE
ncbi:MAG: hypothetical protein ACYCOU_12195 [Sulfobacillus sp.]